MTVIADAVTASKEDVLELYANKWRHSIAQSCASLAQVLQVPDTVALHRVIAGAWPFADQVSLLAFTLWDTSVLAMCRLRRITCGQLVKSKTQGKHIVPCLALHDCVMMSTLLLLNAAR